MIPKFETIGHGQRKWRLSILSLPLSAFMSEVKATFGDSSGRLPVAFWRDSDRTIVLRADRTDRQQLRDMKHELHHAFIDWLDVAWPDPGD